MKKIIILILILLTTNITSGEGQVVHPVSWSYATKKISTLEIIVFFKATLEPGWHIYSLNQKAGGPYKTRFVFDESPDFELLGKPTEPVPIKMYEQIYEMDLLFFNTSVIFKQRLKLRSPKSITKLKGSVFFMACTDKECLPETQTPFLVSIN